MTESETRFYQAIRDAFERLADQPTITATSLANEFCVWKTLMPMSIHSSARPSSVSVPISFAHGLACPTIHGSSPALLQRLRRKGCRNELEFGIAKLPIGNGSCAAHSGPREARPRWPAPPMPSLANGAPSRLCGPARAVLAGTVAPPAQAHLRRPSHPHGQRLAPRGSTTRWDRQGRTRIGRSCRAQQIARRKVACRKQQVVSKYRVLCNPREVSAGGAALNKCVFQKLPLTV